MVGDMSLRGRISSARCFSFNGTSFGKADWNWPIKIFALSEAFVYVTPFDFKEVISLLSDFCCTGPRSAVDNVSGYRCMSDCISRAREFDPGPVPYFRGD